MEKQKPYKEKALALGVSYQSLAHPKGNKRRRIEKAVTDNPKISIKELSVIFAPLTSSRIRFIVSQFKKNNMGFDTSEITTF